MQIFEDSKAMQEKLANQGQHLDRRSEKISDCLLERLSSLAQTLEEEDSEDPDIKVGVIMADRINKIRLAKKGLFSLLCRVAGDFFFSIFMTIWSLWKLLGCQDKLDMLKLNEKV